MGGTPWRCLGVVMAGDGPHITACTADNIHTHTCAHGIWGV